MARNIYSDATTSFSETGDKTVTKVTVELDDNLGKIVTSIGSVKMLKDGEINITSTPVCDTNGNVTYKIDIQGDKSIVNVTFDKDINIEK